MKITKIPGLGRFGVFVDDVDLTTISHDEWMEIGKIHLDSLVTIIRGNDLDHATYYDLFTQWGTPRYSRPVNFYLKYGKSMKDLVLNNELDEADKNELRLGRLWQPDKRRPGMIRVTGKVNQNGDPLGVFDSGELLWHSNECSDPAFTPGVSLMGWENMTGSCTGFATTADWFESQTESFKSELRELTTVNNYKPASLNPVIKEQQEQFYKNNMCPIPNGEIPLIITSPGGIEGVHLPAVSFDYFKGMSKEASKKLYDQIWSEIITDKNIYEHWYKNDKDILIFDNSITLHNRRIENNGVSPDRVGYRIQFDYNKLVGDYTPYRQEPFNLQRQERMAIMKKATEGMLFQ
jgi:alpha-ketoglutarate-dependent taurine dioxygenase